MPAKRNTSPNESSTTANIGFGRFRKIDDVRWQPSGTGSTATGIPQDERGGGHQFGVPLKGNANSAWVQSFILHLAPQGMAGFIRAKSSMSSNQSGEGDIRLALIEADLEDCMVALPGQFFYSTQTPGCLWFLAKAKKGARAARPFLQPNTGNPPVPLFATEAKRRSASTLANSAPSSPASTAN
jgi:hypothetical protein